MTGKQVVLVTGGAGLVGHALRAVRERHRVPSGEWIYLSRRDADLTDLEQTRLVFKRHQPRYVVHLAARVGGLFRNMAQPVEMLTENVAMNCNVLRCAMECGVEKLVSCLSTCVFPEAAACPIHEGMLHEGAPHSSNEAYAYAKRMMDVLCRAYRREYGCNYISVIPTNVYGPHDNFHLQDAHVIPALVHKFYLAQKQHLPVRVMGTGRAQRQFIYSEDLAELLLWALQSYNEKEPLILSVDAKDEVSITDVVRFIAEAFEFKGDVVFEAAQPDGQHKKTADNSRLRQYMPSYTFTPLADGIRRSVEWFIANYESARR